MGGLGRFQFLPNLTILSLLASNEALANRTLTWAEHMTEIYPIANKQMRWPEANACVRAEKDTEMAARKRLACSTEFFGGSLSNVMQISKIYSREVPSFLLACSRGSGCHHAGSHARPGPCQTRGLQFVPCISTVA